eukprot:CFRG7101T1
MVIALSSPATPTERLVPIDNLSTVAVSNKPDNANDVWTNSNVIVGVGVATDVVALGSAGVYVGLGIAKASVKYGFWWAKVAASIPHMALSMYSNDEGKDEASMVFGAMRATSAMVDVAERLTLTSIEASKTITTESLNTTRSLLQHLGGRPGHLYRLAGSTVLGLETMEALGYVGGMVMEYAVQSHGSVTDLACGLRTLWALQQHGVAPITGAVIHSIADEMPEIEYYMKFVMGAYGALVLHGLGQIPWDADVKSDLEAISYLARVREEDIVFTQWQSELYRPAYYIALDRQKRKVVVSFRGSMSAVDVLTDLVCDTIPYTFGQAEGVAHAGFARAANRLSTELLPIVRDLLRANEGYTVVLGGHSLGAAVATMVALLWAGIFNGLKCYAYAAPAAVSLNISLEAQCVVTSVVLGSDLVPRLSRTSMEYLRDVAMLLGRDDELRREVEEAIAVCERTSANADTDTMSISRNESMDHLLGEDLAQRIGLGLEGVDSNISMNDGGCELDSEGKWIAVEDGIDPDNKTDAKQRCRELYDYLHDIQPERSEMLAAGKILFLCHETGEGVLTNGELAPHWSRIILGAHMFQLHLPNLYTSHFRNHGKGLGSG